MQSSCLLSFARTIIWDVGVYSMSQQKTKKGSIIYHIDMNCFYASVEVAHNQKLKGKPIAIAGNPEERKGIVVTSSYEARDHGVKTTMPVWKAKQLCPELIVLPPRFDRYRLASKHIFQLLAEITPLVEPVSIDEGYMDVTETDHPVNPVQTAVDLQQRILKELDIPCSIGIAPNKFLAKMASDMKKPLGITILRKRELKNVLWPLPIKEMHGVGAKTAEKLQQMDIETIGDLAKADVYALKQALGINGERMHQRANGVDFRRVDPDSVHDFKSIGSSETLPHDSTDEKELFLLMEKLADKVEKRMKRKQAVGSSVQLMIRYHDRKTITRSKKLDRYIDTKKDILGYAMDLWNKHWNMEPVRLIGITVQDMIEKSEAGEQLDLFTYEQAVKEDKLHTAIHSLTEKYGKNPFIEMNKTKPEDDLQPTTSFQKDFLDDYTK